MASKRRKARIAVMQTLFERGHAMVGSRRRQMPEQALRWNMEELGSEGVDAKFAEHALRGVLENEDRIRALIKEHAPRWPFERMDGIARALLLLGTFELVFGGDAPPAVIMDEAIEIAKEYGTEESAKFVNGVLNAIAHAPRERQT